MSLSPPPPPSIPRLPFSIPTLSSSEADCSLTPPLTYPVEGYLPLQDPPTADLLKAHKLLGFIKNVLSTSIDLQVSSRASRGVTTCLTCRLTRLPSASPQEERLLEKDSALWRLQGDPTVLITLAHIFNHFAPLMVRRSRWPPGGWLR